MAAVVQDDWAAFVKAAPFAVEATVYDVRGPAIAELTDKGTTPVLYLRNEQHRALLEDVDPSRVHSLTDWRKVRRGLRGSPG